MIFRDGSPSISRIFYISLLLRGCDARIRSFVEASRKKLLKKDFPFTDEINIGCTCCDICSQKCDCSCDFDVEEKVQSDKELVKCRGVSEREKGVWKIG